MAFVSVAADKQLSVVALSVEVHTDSHLPERGSPAGERSAGLSMGAGAPSPAPAFGLPVVGSLRGWLQVRTQGQEREKCLCFSVPGQSGGSGGDRAFVCSCRTCVGPLVIQCWVCWSLEHLFNFGCQVSVTSAG